MTTSDKLSAPHATLDRDGKIIDILPSDEPCLSVSSVKALLTDKLTDGDREKLLNICSSGAGTALFDVRMRGYGKCLAVGIKSEGDSFCELYFLSNGENADFIRSPFFKNFLSKNALEILSAFNTNLSEYLTPVSAEELLSPDTPSSSLSSVDVIIEAVITKLSKHPDTFSSRVEIDPQKEDYRSAQTEALPFAVLLTLLLSVLDSASSNGIISLQSNRYANSYEITMKTKSSIQSAGTLSTDVLSLASDIPGSYSKLSLAAYVSAIFGMRITVKRELADDLLSVSFGKIRDFLPPTEFKCNDGLRVVDAVSDASLLLLNLIVTPPAEEAQAEQ